MSTIPIYQPRATNVQNYGLARENSSTAVQNKPKIELNKGDMVHHTAFGKGMVLSVLKMGADALLEIAFDNVGTKKLMANSAAAHLKRL